MYEHHLRDMTQKLFEAKLIREDCGQKEVQEALAAYWEDKIALVWSTEDVKGATSKELTEEQAQSVLTSILEGHDCSLGVTWDTIESEIDNQLG